MMRLILSSSPDFNSGIGPKFFTSNRDNNRLFSGCSLVILSSYHSPLSLSSFNPSANAGRAWQNETRNKNGDALLSLVGAVVDAH